MNKLVLVTGATGGVGSSICQHLLSDYQVLALGRNKKQLNDLSHQLPGIETFCADLANEKDLAGILDVILQKHGYIPYLVNNAGVNVAEPITTLSSNALMKSLYVNAIAPMKIMQRLLPVMSENDFGRIINITSGAPFNCFPGYGAYSASKGALNALTVTAAKEHSSRNIKINLMSPGPVRSGMAPQATKDPSVCHPTLDYLLELEADGPSGGFFWLGYEVPLFPDHEGISWLEGTASNRFTRRVQSS